MQVTSPNRVDFPDGEYEGRASGYSVFIPQFKKYVKMTVGVRGIDVPCTITVKDSVATIKF